MKFLILDSVSGERFSYSPGQTVDMTPEEAQRKLGRAAVPVRGNRAEHAVQQQRSRETAARR